MIQVRQPSTRTAAGIGKEWRCCAITAIKLIAVPAISGKDKAASGLVP
jgi:hypothetical protein